MSETLEVIVGGTTYDLSDMVSYYHLRSAGLGMAPTRRLSQQGPMQHGVSDVGFRLEARKLQLVLLLSEASEAAYWTQRDSLLRIFKPRNTALLLRYTAGSVVRQIDCHYSGGLDLGSDGRMIYSHQVPAELYCPDPSWYDPVARAVTLGLGSLAGATNEIANPGFETAGGGGGDIWASWVECVVDGALADEGVLVHSGSHAMKVTAGPTLFDGVAQQRSVTPGVTYPLSFWTRGDGTHAGRYRVTDVTHGVPIIDWTSTGVTGTSYQQVSVDVTVPSGCTDIQVQFWCPSTNGGIAYFDDAALYMPPGMEVPLSIPWHVGASILDVVRSVTYAGSWDSYPIATIRGPVTDPVLTNNTTGDKLDLTGTTIAPGDEYVIDCRYGQKTVVRQSDGANRIQDLTDDSDLATFALLAADEAPGGVNDFHAQGTGVTAATEIYLQYYDRYIGV